MRFRSFDLIISDVEMPNLDGFGLCARLKDNPATRGIPVIILSSLDTDRDVEQGFNVRARRLCFEIGGPGPSERNHRKGPREEQVSPQSPGSGGRRFA